MREFLVLFRCRRCWLVQTSAMCIWERMIAFRVWRNSISSSTRSGCFLSYPPERCTRGILRGKNWITLICCAVLRSASLLRFITNLHSRNTTADPRPAYPLAVTYIMFPIRRRSERILVAGRKKEIRNTDWQRQHLEAFRHRSDFPSCLSVPC